ncbi:MAG: sialate O-acetylesterase [Phycisphaerales bacterium]
MMQRTALVLALSLGAVPVNPASAEGDLRLPAILANNMVLQQAAPFTLWGWAGPGEAVAVTASFAPAPISVRADEKGRWSAVLEIPSLSNAPEAARASLAAPQQITITAGTTITLENLLIGEVWVCGGQSNMEWPLRASDGGADAARAAARSDIRYFDVRNTVSAEPAEDCTPEPLGGSSPGWVECSPLTAPNFSAVGFHFARALTAKLGVPVGLVGSNWGGTPAEAWANPATLRTMPAFEATLAKTQEKDAKLGPNMPGVLFSGMIAPISTLSIRGAIWYQGESNVGRAEQYRTLFPAMISDWRAAFSRPEMPFYFVQIAPFGYGNDTGQAAQLRDAQASALSMAGTGMVVTLDIGDPKDIHPRDKKTVGQRLAAWALCRTYGFPATECAGPYLTSLEPVKDSAESVVANFSNDHIMTAGADPIAGFEVAGPDGTWRAAQATLLPHGVRLDAAGIGRITKARYAWCSGCEGLTIIKNHWGFPMRPFSAAVSPAKPE